MSSNIYDDQMHNDVLHIPVDPDCSKVAESCNFPFLKNCMMINHQMKQFILKCLLKTKNQEAQLHKNKHVIFFIKISCSVYINTVTKVGNMLLTETQC